MPSQLTYPGVYIKEIASGVRTITGVATSITAFIGRAYWGAVNEPVQINSYGDFERQFGGLQENYPMSYAIRDFFLNGGSQALIVRLVSNKFGEGADAEIAEAKKVAEATTGADTVAAKAAAKAVNDSIQLADNKATVNQKLLAKNVWDKIKLVADIATVAEVKAAAEVALKEAKNSLPTKAKLKLSGDSLVLEAASEGIWGNDLLARVDTDNLATNSDFFNLTIFSRNTGKTERFLNLTCTTSSSPKYVKNVLEKESNLVRFVGSVGPKPVVTTIDTKELDDIIAAGAKTGADEAQKQAATAATKKKVKDEKSPYNPTDVRNYKGVADGDKCFEGVSLDEEDITGVGFQSKKQGLYALDKADIFNLLCIPPDARQSDTPSSVYVEAAQYCKTRRAMLIVDPPHDWGSNKETAASDAKKGLSALNLVGEDARNAVLFFPRVMQPDPLREGQLEIFPPCGIIAGIMARTDSTRGVWKAPAGIDATLTGVQGLQINLNDAENGMLNPLGINCLRFFPVYGRVAWGARTMRGADQVADEWKYTPVRRLALYMEESLYRGTQWVVFEPNDEPLWAQIRLNIGAFMNNLFRQGAFQGSTSKEAYFVKCDSENNPQNDINLGIVNISVGFLPLKPAEFVVISFQQIAGNIAT
jgi:uncharacterized protein